MKYPYPHHIKKNQRNSLNGLFFTYVGASLLNYNKAFVSDKNYFENTIMNQPLWGNKYITHMTRCKKNVLFLRNWIRSGVKKIGDLVFSNGILNEQFVYEKVACKQNILCEIMLVKKALYPYQQS